MNRISLLLLALIVLIASCAQTRTMHQTTYEAFSADVERPPELLNGPYDQPNVNPALVKRIVNGATQPGRELYFVRMVKSKNYCYYVFGINHVEDAYYVFVSRNNSDIDYKFMYAGA